MRFAPPLNSSSVPSLATAWLPEAPLLRLFFRGAVAVALTLGASWGVWLLLRIAASGSFTAIGIHEVNAHGHAQVFGWVGLMVMGFAYTSLTASAGWTRTHRHWAQASFWLMACGLTVRSLGEAFATAGDWLHLLALAGSATEIVAVLICLRIVVAVVRPSQSRLEASDYFMFASLGWFLVQAIYDALYFSATIRAPDPQQLLGLIATWQAPLREIQIHGLAMLMIFGITQQILPQWYGIGPSNGRWSLMGLVGLNLALLGIVFGLILMRQAGHAWAGLWYLSILSMAAISTGLTFHWGTWRRPVRFDPSLNYLRAAYVWLLISLAMAVALPIYQFVLLPTFAPQSHAVAIGFSHAYYGAIRHAVTVGFVSTALMGVAARLAVQSWGVRLEELHRSWLPLILVNIGCALRVTGQTLTDMTFAAFPWAGVSGLLEIAGLALWGLHLWRLMNQPFHSQASRRRI